MALKNEVRDEVLQAFRPGDQLGAQEVMARTRRGRIVYKYIAELVAAGHLRVLRLEAMKRKPRKIFGLPAPAEAAPF